MSYAIYHFTIVTATFNAAQCLPGLIESLKQQSDTDFEWVVADGASTDDTLNLLKEASKTLRIKIDSRPDFGIYDGLNRAIKMATGDYYLVVGADDELFPDTVANYKRACNHSLSDFVTARIEVDGRICGVRGLRWACLYGQAAYISGHAVGVAIKCDLHESFGFYSRMFPIAADQLFILKSIRGGASVSEQDFIAGRFNTLGTSGQDLIGSFVEGFRVNLSVGFGFWTQLVLFVLRLIKYRILQSFKRWVNAIKSRL